MKSAFAIFFILLFPVLLQGQTFQPHSINYSVEDGVPSSECYEVMQDSKGFIWTATDKGICKFNGYTFTKFTTDDGLPDNTVFGFFEDSKHRFWGRTLAGGLFYFEHDSIHIPAFNNNLKKKLAAGIINQIYVTDDDSVYVETRGLQFFFCHLGSTEVRQNRQGKNTLRFFNKKGILFWNYPNGVPVPKIDMEFRYKDRLLQHSEVTTISPTAAQRIELKNGGFVLCFAKNLICYNERRDKLSTHGFSTLLLSVFEDRDKGLWVGVLNDGV